MKKIYILMLIIWLSIIYLIFWFKYVTFDSNLSSNACYWWNIYLNTFFNKKIIFENNINKSTFAYCTPKIERVDINNYNIFICYEWWAWSWECWAIKFNYNLNNNSWKYLDNWYFSFNDSWYVYKNISKDFNNNSWVLDFIKYINVKKYNFKFENTK